MSADYPRWVLLGYGPFGRRVLETAIEEDWAPIAVMTHTVESDLDPVSVESVATAAGLPVATEHPNSNGYSFLLAQNADVIFTVNYRWILSEKVLALPRLGGFNIHDSLLPTLRGRSPLTWAIILGHGETGATVHVLDGEVDTGDVVIQHVIPITVRDTSHTIQQALLAAYPGLVRETLRQVAAGALETTPQTGAVSYGEVRRPEDGEIDWSWDARRLYNWVRALTKPYPGAFTFFAGDRLIVWQVSIIEMELSSAPPGTVVGRHLSVVTGEGWSVACGRGIVSLDVFEPDLELAVGLRLGSVENHSSTIQAKDEGTDVSYGQAQG